MLSPEFITTITAIAASIALGIRQVFSTVEVNKKAEAVDRKTDSQTDLLTTIAAGVSNAERGVTVVQESMGRLDTRLLSAQEENRDAHKGFEKRLDRLETEQERAWRELNDQRVKIDTGTNAIHRHAAEIALMKQAGKMRSDDTKPLDATTSASAVVAPDDEEKR